MGIAKCNMWVNVHQQEEARNWNVKGLNWEAAKAVTFFNLFIPL